MESIHASQSGLAGTFWVVLHYPQSEDPRAHSLPVCLNLLWGEGESHIARRPLHVPTEIMKSWPASEALYSSQENLPS